MQRWISILAVLLGLQVAIAAALEVRGDRLAPSRPDTRLVAADLKGVDHLSVDGPVAPDTPAGGATKVELAKRDGRWIMPGYYDAPADAGKVASLLDRLGTLKRGFPVATSGDAPKRFKVATNDYERRLVMRAGDKVLATVYLGTSPGLRKADARTEADKAVYSVALATFELPTGPSAWLDPGLLGKDAARLTEIDIAAAGKPPLTLQQAAAKTGGAGKWDEPGLPADRRIDANQAAALAHAIADLKVDAVLGTSAKAEWQQDQPQLALTFRNGGSAPVTWTLSKPKQGDFLVLKASDHPWFLEVKSYDARPLLDASAPDKLVVAANPAPAAGDKTAATKSTVAKRSVPRGELHASAGTTGRTN